MDLQDSLSNHLLIAMPGMADPNFNSTVTLVCEHNTEGALGIVINRPMNMNLGGLLEQLSLDQSDQELANSPVLDGGPVGRERGFVLHNPHGTFETSVAVSDDIQLTLSRDVLDAMAAGTGPDKSLVMLHNTWLSVPANPEIIFDVPFNDRWTVAAKIIGVDISQMSSHAGHA
jgi:putative transcriptional regulator